MSDTLIDENELWFVLYELLDIESLCPNEYFQEHSRETFDMTLKAAFKMARGLLLPGYQECDRIGVQFDGRNATVPEPMHAMYKAVREGGWIAPSAPFEYGGHQLPMTMQIAVGLIFNAANVAMEIYLEGCFGTGHLLQSFGSEQLVELYVEKLYSGQWSGTMALTEAQAGSSLADVEMTAEKIPNQEYYLLNGAKCFITSGDHDLTENIVHMTLARIKGAPSGVRGLSLFVVPKFRVKDDGTLGVFNDVATIKIEHKMGLKGSATALLNYGENNDCRGWLVGEENNGLAYMFQMMNEARIFAGVQGISLASCAYHHALEYTRIRHQGRPFAERDPIRPQSPIIEHPDVKRMLLMQKSFVSGIITLVLFTTFCQDQARTCEADSADQERWLGLYEILTPVCKAYGSDLSFESVSLAMQCLGGYGYTAEFPIEQQLRDCRLFSIFEGTNGIQAQDLLSRRITMNNGAPFRLVLDEITASMNEICQHPELASLADTVGEALKSVEEATDHLLFKRRSGAIEEFISPASLYLEMFSQLVVAWMHLKRCLAAIRVMSEKNGQMDFYQGCLMSARYYIAYVLPRAVVTGRIICSVDPIYGQMDERHF